MRRTGDILLAALVLAIISMLVIPLPTLAIDVLIVLNISISLLLLFLGLYMPSSLSLLSFPTLLLLTTLFRLSLNVASARLILSQADAGVVIHAFGTFLIRGELFVGLVIFTIVTIVNFLVIAKGAARVSEVAARFVLDALPGKQSSIDSDLRAGLISPEVAKQKREDLRKESQLFGAMDGAMKFVQGDAIAGIIIIFVNIIGGLYLGLSRGMEIGSAAQTYTILTVGDGLVSQIPALLISICAGIVVTRVSSNDGLTLGSDLSLQLFAHPSAIVATGGLLMVLGLFPGIPFLPFFGVGSVFVLFGLFVRPPLQQAELVSGTMTPSLLRLPFFSGESRAGDDRKGAPKALPQHGEPHPSNLKEPLRVLLGMHAFDLLKHRFESTNARWDDLRHQVHDELGVWLPGISFEKSESLSPLQLHVRGEDIRTISTTCSLDALLIPIRKHEARALGFDIIADEQSHPFFGTPMTAVSASPETSRLLEGLALRGADSLEYILLQAATALLEHPEQLISFQALLTEMKHFEQQSSGLRSDTMSRFFISPPKLHQLLCTMIKEHLAITDLPLILQTISEVCIAHKISAADDTDVALKPLLDHVRRKLSRRFTQSIPDIGTRPMVFVLSDAFVKLLETARYDELLRSMTIDEAALKAFKDQWQTFIVQRLRSRGTAPATILCPEEVRLQFRMLLESLRLERGVTVCSVKEFDPSQQFLVAGVFGVDFRGGI
jgi:type III secretion protein V